MKPAASLAFLLALIVAACSKKTVASTDFKLAMDDVRKELHVVTASFPAEEAALNEVRTHHPAAAARQIETQIVPMLDRVIAAMDRAHRTGLHYLAAAEDEDASVLARIRRNVDKLAPMRDAFARMRGLYREEAAMLKQGPVTAPDELRISQGVIDAMRVVAAS